MKNVFKLVSIIAIVAVGGFSLINCDNSGDGGGGTGWRTKKVTNYTVTDEVASVSSESVYNWIIYRLTSYTDYEEKYTITSAAGSTTYHATRNGLNFVYTSESSSSNSTTTTLYDSASGLTLRGSSTSTSSGTTSSYEYTYNIELLSDSDGVKTYKYYMYTYINNGTSLDLSTQGYSEYKIQNGRTLEAKTYSANGELLSHSTYDNNGNIREQKTYTAAGVLSSTTTYTLSDDPVIKAKLGNYTLTSRVASSYTSYTTVEVVSDSASELVIRQKSYFNNVFSSQTDTTYEKA